MDLDRYPRESAICLPPWRAAVNTSCHNGELTRTEFVTRRYPLSKLLGTETGHVTTEMMM